MEIFTYLDYNTNINISDKAPTEYVSDFRNKLADDEFRKTCAQNAIPDHFESMGYMDFLQQRRMLMAHIVKRAYARLCS